MTDSVQGGQAARSWSTPEQGRHRRREANKAEEAGLEEEQASREPESRVRAVGVTENQASAAMVDAAPEVRSSAQHGSSGHHTQATLLA